MAMVTVTKIINGDSFEVNKRSKSIHILGIRAPEEGESGYEIAKNNLEKVIGGKEVELRKEGNGNHGEIVANVYLNGLNILHDLYDLDNS